MKQPLRKKYRTFNSLEALQKAQKQVKKEYRDLENNAMSNIFDPVQIGFSVLPKAVGLFSGNKTERKQRKAVKRVEQQSKKAVQEINTLVNNTTNTAPTAITPNKKKGINIVNLSKNDSFGKKVFASFIRWQLIELGIWGVRKILSKKK